MSLKINNPSGVTVVQGYHFGFKTTKKDPKHKHNYVNPAKPYNFRVTNRTKFPNRAKVGLTCKVNTKQGIRKIVITKIMHVKGAVAVKFAKRLQAVRQFSYFGMYPRYLYKILDSKTGLKLKAQRLTDKQFKELVNKSTHERHIINGTKPSKHTKHNKRHHK